jgi:transcriptional regulator with XRE-family HTH domain
MVSVGDRLKQIRDAFAMSQKDLADSLGVERSYISKVETGAASNLSEQFILSLCNTYYINKNWFLTGEGDIWADAVECLQEIIVRMGAARFWAAVSVLSNQNGESVTLDQDLTEMLDYLKLLWHNGDRDIRGWIKVQFRGAFRDFGETKKKPQMAAEEPSKYNS